MAIYTTHREHEPDPRANETGSYSLIA